MKPEKTHDAGGRGWPARLWVPVLIATVCSCCRTLPAASAQDTLAARRAEVAKLDPAGQKKLKQLYEQFQALEPAERARISGLHEQIDRDEDPEELRRVLGRYYDWLSTLKQYQRTHLWGLSPEERIEWIKRLKEWQAEFEADWGGLPDAGRFDWIKQQLSKDPTNQNVEHLTLDDLKGLLRWIEASAPRLRARLRESRPEEDRQGTHEDPARRRGPPHLSSSHSVMWLLFSLRGRSEDLPPGMEAELPGLRSELSPVTRAWLQSMPQDEQWQTIRSWIGLLIGIRFDGARYASAPSSVMSEELADFLENEVEPEDRDRLLSYSAEKMDRELWRMYLRAKMPEMAFLFSDGPGRGYPGRGGPSRGGPSRSSRGPGGRSSGGPGPPGSGRDRRGTEGPGSGRPGPGGPGPSPEPKPKGF